MAGPWEEYQTTKAPAATGPIIVRSRDEVLGQLDRLNTPAAPPPSGPWTEYQQPAPPKATDEERRTVLGFLGNAAKSTGSLLGGLVNVPEQVKGMTSLFAGMAEKSGYKALPGQPDVNAVDALIAHYKDRYGSLEGFKKAMYEDPAGVMFDVATVLEPAGAGLKAAGLPRAAAATTRAARAMNPVVQTVRAGGAIARGAAPAVEFAAAGARAAAPDVAIGTAKIGAGYALEQMLPGAGPLKYAFELPTVYSGARQIQRGLKKGVAAGREALKARAAAAAEALAAETEAAAATAARPEPPPSIIPPERQLGPGPIITPPPADTSGTVRGLPPAQYPEVIPPGPLRTKPGASDAALAMREAMGLGQEEFRLPEASAPDFAAITQAGHVDRVARLMRENGLTAADALLLDPPDWINLARSAGIVKPDAGGALAREVVLRLQSLEPKPKAPAKPRTQPAAPEAAVVPPAPPPPAARVTPEAEALAREMPGYRAPEGELPRAPTASETRVETIAKAIAAYKIPMADLEQLAEHAPMVENLARSLKLARPAAGEIPLIVKRIRELRGAGPPAPPAAAAEATIRTDVQSTPTPGPPPREQPRGPRPPVYGPREPGQGTAPGRSAVVRVPGESTTYAGRYAVRDLGDVHASHNPHTFAKNPDYHFRNDRDYSDPTNKERVVVNSMKDVFDPAYPLADSPDATHGAPVIDSRGNVLGGNSRAMILDRVYTSNPEGAAAYRAELEKAAPQFGIEPQQFAHMKRPVLVRELSDAELGPERAQRAITDLNKRGTADLTTAERATSDARRMSPAAADYLAGQIEAEGAEASLTDVLAGKRGVEIINKLVDDGVFTMQEKPTLVDSRTGSVTAAAKERISKMLLGQVFESSDQLVRTPAEIRAKLERVVSPILQAGQKAGFDILPTVREAIDLVEYARVHGIKNLADAVAQESMFADAPRFSAEALQLADYLQARKPTEIAKAFRRYVANAEPTMYGESTAAEAFADAFGAAMPPEAAKMAPAEAEAAFQQQKAKAGKRKAPKAKN